MPPVTPQNPEINLPNVLVIVRNNIPQYTVDSLLSQDYPNFAIFLIVRAESDLSWGKIEGGILHYKEAQIPFVIDPEYKTVTFNQILQATHKNTHIYGFVGEDIVWGKRKVSKCVNRFVKYPEHVGLIYTDGDEYRPIFHPQQLFSDNFVFPKDYFVSNLVFKTVGLFHEGLQVGEDHELLQRVSQKFIISRIPESLSAKYDLN